MAENRRNPKQAIPAMTITVRELIAALEAVPQDMKVSITYAGYDERSIGCITKDRTCIRLCDHSAEVSKGEKIEWIDTEVAREHGQFGVGA